MNKRKAPPHPRTDHSGDGQDDAAIDERGEAEREAVLTAAERPLVDDLRRAGVQVSSAWDLVESRRIDERAVPVLLQHLSRPYPEVIREGIAHALATPASTRFWHDLRKRYLAERAVTVKDGLAVALASALPQDGLHDLIALANDSRNGPSRILFFSALSKHAAGREALARYMREPELRQEAERVLRRGGRRTPSQQASAEPKPEVLEEVSLSLDLPDLRNFLTGLAATGIGLRSIDLDGIPAQVEALEVDQAVSMDFELSGDDPSTLRTVAELDDPESLDLYFFAPAATAAKVARFVERYINTSGAT